MPVINIKEEWKTDPRRRLLTKRLGNDRLADGMMVEVAWLIITYGGEPIPLAKWEFIENHQEWVDCGLAEIQGEHVIVKGAGIYSRFFERQRTNGAKGGRPPHKTHKTHNNPLEPKHNPLKPTDNPGKPFPFSSSFSSSYKNINTSLGGNGGNVDKSVVNVDNSDSMRQAELCLKGISKFGAMESDKLREFVGAKLFEKVRMNGGWQAVREAPRDQWAVKNLANRLKDF